MNKLLYCFFLSFSVIATSACTDDKEEREFPPAPDFSLMILKENLHSNGGDVLRTDTYVYDNNKLTTHTTLQEFYGQSLTHETTLSYSCISSLACKFAKLTPCLSTTTLFMPDCWAVSPNT